MAASAASAASAALEEAFLEVACLGVEFLALEDSTT